MSISSPPLTQLSPIKQALLEIKQMRSQLERADKEKHEPIAIVSIGCRFPGGCDDPEAFWQLLQKGQAAITDLPSDRWDVGAYYDPNPETPGKMYVRRGGFLPTVDQFDPQFFGISPREAISMDPQQRLLLEVSWEALERAGKVPAQLTGSLTGVFIGIMNSHYTQRQTKFEDFRAVDTHTVTGGLFSVASGRLSYTLGLQGPNLAVDTACSSSLVTFHLAAQSLRNRECDLALAGGVNLILAPEPIIERCKAKMLSPDGYCKTFDAAADGYGIGEGCGIVVLKRLSDAQGDGDPILAVIYGSAINHDGPSSGLTVPNGPAQQALLKRALANARVEPHQISYVETHGTGTSLGDPIEVQALGKVLHLGRADNNPVILGSVKTNIGHLESAAGVAGLIKVVLALQHQEIPPHPHLQQLNEHIFWESLPVRVATRPTPWPANGRSRYAGISSFGISGTNVHLVVGDVPQAPAVALLQDADGDALPATPHEVDPPQVHLLPLSAQSPEALHSLIRSYQTFLSAAEGTKRLRDICYSASTGRSHHSYRLGIVGEAIADLNAQLTELLDTAPSDEPFDTVRRHRQGLVFVCSGQGGQWLGMGRSLLHQAPLVRETLEQCDALLSQYADWSIVDELQANEESSRLAQTAIAQPVIFALQIALARLWQSWGIVPQAVVGHSMGEVAAAHIAGALSLEEAIRIIVHRGRLMQAAAGSGQMVAVGLSIQEAEDLIRPYKGAVVIAAYNSPTSLLLSGAVAALDTVMQQLEQQGRFCHPLAGDYAFHSPQMRPFADQLVQELGSLRPRPLKLAWVSTVTGTAIEPEALGVQYWAQNVQQPVQFETAIAGLLRAGYTDFLEIGPHPVLTRPLLQCLEAQAIQGTVLGTLAREQPARTTLLKALGQLYTLGYDVNWSALYATPGEYVSLPTYPFQRDSYWLAPEPSQPYGSVSRRTQQPIAPLLERRLDSPVISDWQFETELSSTVHTYLADHQLFGMTVVPAVVYLEMALEAGGQFLKTDACCLENLLFREALVLSEDEPRLVQLILTPQGNEAAFQIFSRETTSGTTTWILHVSGTMRAQPPASAPLSPAALKTGWSSCSLDTLYERIYQTGLQLGTRFRGVGQVWQQGPAAVGQILLPDTLAVEAPAYQLHPVLLDASWQILTAILMERDTAAADPGIYIPVSLEQLRFYGPAETLSPTSLWCYGQIQADEKAAVVGKLQLVDEQGRTVAELEGLRLQQVNAETLQRSRKSPAQDWFYELAWQPQSLVSTAASQRAKGLWILCAQDQALTTAIRQHLEQQGVTCILVTSGETYEEADHAYQVNPACREHFERLLTTIATVTATPIQGIIHLWGTDTPTVENVAALQAAQEHSCGSLLQLTQVIANSQSDTVPRLWVVTQNSQAVDAAAPIAVAPASLWGLGRVIAHEHPELWGGLIDLDQQDTVTQQAASLWHEVTAATAESQVAWRADQRFVLRLVRQRPQPSTALAIHSEAIYLVTGGLGGLGLHVAQWLAAQGARHLALLGRSAPTSEATAIVEQLERSGVQVSILQADVADSDQLAQALGKLTESPWPLLGIIHAAGVLDDGVLQQQTWQRFTRVMVPKVQGAWNLHMLTQDHPLDFFGMFSSVVSVLGAPGQGNYAAANAFLDALAYHRKQRGLAGLSLNWGPWSDTGMAASLGESGKRQWSNQGMGMITPEQGIRALEQQLQSPGHQILILPINWHQYTNQLANSIAPLVADLLEQPHSTDSKPAAVSAIRQQLETAAPDEKHALLTTFVQKQVTHVLKLPPDRPPQLHQSLFEMGLDSLMSLELRNFLTKKLGEALPSTLIFNYPTIAALVTYIAEQVLALTPPDPDPDSSEEDNALPALEDLDQLSTDEMAMLLSNNLASLDFTD